MCHGFIPFIASVAQVQSGSITKATADVVMGDIRCICYRADHNLRKYCHSSYDSGVKFRLSPLRHVLIFATQIFCGLFLSSDYLFHSNPKQDALAGLGVLDLRPEPCFAYMATNT
jgi:hypothetical protein